MREHISQFTDEELMEVYELDRTTLNSLAPRAAVLMRKYIDNDDSWTYHRDYAISEAVSEYKEDKYNGRENDALCAANDAGSACK